MLHYKDWNFYFCFNDSSKLHKPARGLKMKILNWKFVCIMFLAISTNYIISLFITFQTKKFYLSLHESSCPFLRSPWFLPMRDLSKLLRFYGIVTFIDSMKIYNLCWFHFDGIRKYCYPAFSTFLSMRWEISSIFSIP